MGTRAALSKKSIELLGRKYAELLLRNAKASPRDLPELDRHEGWRQSNRYAQDGYAGEIKMAAQTWLLSAGFDRGIVMTVLGRKK